MAAKVPRLTPGVDIRSFKLDPTDGFLLTRIDGKLGPNELARETGLPDFSVVRALEKLEKLGVIQLIDPSAPPPAAPPPSQPRVAPAAAFDVSLLAPKYDPAELDEPVDLQPEQKKRVLDLFYRLEDLDHYTLLGVTQEADKKTIKRSYFELAAVFHPDRYFKKNLGSFKQKMEALFTRITAANDTLTNAAARAEYDAYLAEVATTRGMEAMLERALAEASRVANSAPASQPVSISASSSAPPVSAPSSAPAEAPRTTSSGSLAAASAEEIQRRKEALARRLTGKNRPFSPPPVTSQPPPDSNPLRYTNSQDAVDALKRRYLERIDGATQAQAARHVQAAEDALAKNDVVAAANAFSIALKFAPEDAGLAARAQEARDAADKILAESYLKQAQYEERQGHWLEAGRSWQKLAKVRNDAHSHERAAHALIQTAEGDLHEAADHAKRAVNLQPSGIANHVTLLEVYLKAGLVASARRAADAARAIDANHAGLQALLKQIPKA